MSPNLAGNHGTTWILVLGWRLLLNYRAHLVYQKYSLLDMVLPFKGAQILNNLGISQHLLDDM